MIDDLIQHLNALPLASLMLVVAIGCGLGRISWRSIALGSAGGTMGIAVLLGVLGLDFRALYGSANPSLTVGQFGFALFIYSVGFEAGPRFFSSLFGGRGWRFVVVGLVVSVLALGLAFLCGRLFDLGGPITAGVLAGALTSPAAYGVALESVYAHPDLAGPLGVSFALVYPIGLVGIVLLIQTIPRARGRDLAREAEEREGRQPWAETDLHTEFFRTFEVTREEAMGKTLAGLDLPHRTGCYVAQIHRGELMRVVDATTVLQPGDHVLACGRPEELKALSEIVGPEIDDEDLRHRMPAPRRIIVHASDVVGRTLAEIDLARRKGCLVVSIERGDVRIESRAETHIERGDVLEVIGRHSDVQEAARALGRLERPTHETDIGVYAGGIVLGILIGVLSIDILNVHFSLGMAGGLLLSGILLGRYRRIGPFHTHVPRAARQLVRDLGILLFVAEAGVHAGGSSLAGLDAILWPMLGVGLILSILPVLGALWVGCRILRMRSIDVWGSVSGGMTSASGLSALVRVTESNDPAVSYAASYAVASVVVTIAGRAILLLLG